MDLGLNGRAFIVSGGSRGLGFAAASALVAEGARVLLSSRVQANLDRAVESLGEGAIGVAADLTAAATPTLLIAAARESFGRLDGAFISHGGPPAGPAVELDDERLRETLEVATIGPIRMVREVVAALDGGGSVVVLTSASSVEPVPGLASSNVARPAVWGYVKTLADEVASRGIRVNALLPGRYATERVAELDAAAAAREGIAPEEVSARDRSAIPLGRIGDPQELGRVAAFLLSPAASFVTGAAWLVDGGFVRGL